MNDGGEGLYGCHDMEINNDYNESEVEEPVDIKRLYDKIKNKIDINNDNEEYYGGGHHIITSRSDVVDENNNNNNVLPDNRHPVAASDMRGSELEAERYSDNGSYDIVEGGMDEQDDLRHRDSPFNNSKKTVIIPDRGILKKRQSLVDADKVVKSVRFKEEIAEFVDPPAVGIVKDEEYGNVLESYVSMCAKLKVKPSNKLMDQLEGLHDSTLRLDTIDLKGTRLDSAHCEALESVLRVLQAQTLNIEQTQLDDDGAISLFEMIEYYEPVTRLIVANNIRLGVRSWLALARLLKRFYRLEYLDVRRTSLDESTMPLLCRVLKLNCTLRVLHLEDNQLSGILIRNLVWGLRTNTMLQDLFLGHNRLTAEDAKLIGSLLITNHTIRLLDLRNNRLQDTGIIFLASALEEQLAGLQLITVWSNQITASSMPSLSRALAFHTTLEGVNLGSNAIGNKGVECLKEGLLSSRSIARLVMASCTITNEGAVVMAEIIGDHNTLIHLDLRENNITLAGVMALKCAYAINQKLLRLHLDVMKKANHDPLMEKLLHDIESYSIRNLELHKKSDQIMAESLQKQDNSSSESKDSDVKTSEQTLQEQVDYQIALKLQKQEEDSTSNGGVNKKEEKRPLPIISPVMSSPPDPTKSFGFFSGHYMKLKQKWDENFGMYLNKSDVSLAASPGSTEIVGSAFYQSKSDVGDSEDEEYEDALEEQQTDAATTKLSKLTSIRDSIRISKTNRTSVRTLISGGNAASANDISDNNTSANDGSSSTPRDLPLEHTQRKDITYSDSSDAATPLTPSSDPPNTKFDEIWYTGPEKNYATSPDVPSDVSFGSSETTTNSSITTSQGSSETTTGSSTTTSQVEESESMADSCDAVFGEEEAREFSPDSTSS